MLLASNKMKIQPQIQFIRISDWVHNADVESKESKHIRILILCFSFVFIYFYSSIVHNHRVCIFKCGTYDFFGKKTKENSTL